MSNLKTLKDIETNLDFGKGIYSDDLCQAAREWIKELKTKSKEIIDCEKRLKQLEKESSESIKKYGEWEPNNHYDQYDNMFLRWENEAAIRGWKFDEVRLEKIKWIKHFFNLEDE